MRLCISRKFPSSIQEPLFEGCMEVYACTVIPRHWVFGPLVVTLGMYTSSRVEDLLKLTEERTLAVEKMATVSG